MTRKGASGWITVVGGAGALALLVGLVGGCSSDGGAVDSGSKPVDASDGRMDVQSVGDKGAQPPPDVGRRDGPVAVFECAAGMPDACCALIKQHEAALAQAKACSTGSTGCTKVIAGDLPCGCKTIVDAANTAAIDTMTKLERDYQSASCPAGADCGCVDPKRASCEALGGANKCIDIL